MPHFIIKLLILVAWLSQAQGREIHPARIYAVKNSGKLEFTCSTHGMKETFEKNSNLYIYLCRNGTGIAMKSDCQDVTFIIDDITKDDTGDYSCVFSSYKYDPEDVRGNGINSIFITVNDSFIPAEIASPETSVKMGSDVDLQCTSLKLPERNQKGNVYAYLYKNGYTVQNGTVIQVNIWDTVKNKARFTLKEVTMRDAGTYFCFLMSEPCTFPKEVHGINEVNLNITDPRYEVILTETYDPVRKRNILRLGFSGGVIIIACCIVIFDFKTSSRSSSSV
ncbi:uncharacterized protein LOC108264701 [Ictalurus punctatus]|uniref:Uncharacterized protein LOC108264701 n=1 Tax=Ictalurus punctatus TaxID=7998 RepID=A0A2D0QW34_ICTPU|nr:uncharacterized protein LOC108264701 [Ictalurus punctatus]